MDVHIVDAFTDRPFKGNPAGVCLVETNISSEQMLSIAQELGLSETAFLNQGTAERSVAIRYFSPVMEIPLCGHATLASAKVLFERHGGDAVTFRNINELTYAASLQGDEIVLEFPIYETVPAEAPFALLEALGIPSVINVEYNAETKILLLEIESPLDLARLRPDYSALYRSHDAINGVLVTAPSGDNDYDYHSRYFWPWSGTNEDPVTGGTQTFLAKYWGKRLGKTKMRSYQSSKRTGFLRVELLDETVLIAGQAHIVLKGKMLF